MRDFLKMIRCHHYMKNLLVFSALAFSGQMTDTDKLLAGVIGFFAFCAASSFVYIVNDLRDREKDRLHPKKKDRPIASGRISTRTATITAIVCLLLALGLICLRFSIESLSLLAAYIILNLLYSWKLKDIPLLDVAILVSGFFIRVLLGGVITDIAVSNWLLLTVISFSFFLSFGKRRNELKTLDGSSTRAVLSGYTVTFLDKSMYLCLALAVVFYSLWSVGDTTIDHYHSNKVVLSVPIVLFITLRYCMDIEKETSDGDPVEVLLHDKILILLCTAYAVFMMMLLYVL